MQQYLDRITAYDKAGPALNAIQNVNPRALAEADSLDAVLRARKPTGSLHCIPVLLKDQVETRDMPTTFTNQPTPIAADVLTNPRPKDDYGKGDNRGLSPAIGFPALTVPAGFTTDALPVGLEFLGRPFTEEMLLGFGYAFEQATHHRRPPPGMPALPKTH